MSHPVKLISSMATRLWLEDAVADWAQRGEQPAITVESVGGVDAAKRVRAGEGVDLVLLASNAIDKLIADGKVVAGSRVNLVDSGVAVAVRRGVPRPAIDTEAALRNAVLAARTIGYSTGPSGVALAARFQSWGIDDQIRGRIVEAPPGVPVGSLVARGEVELGFQQLSELMPLDGIDVIGPLPPDVQITTTFSAGLATAATQSAAARRFVTFLAADESAALKRRHGLEPSPADRS